MKPILSINSLSYRIGNRTLFNAKHLTANEGDIIHVRGDSGVGKSLFGLCLIGFHAAQAEGNYDFEINSNERIDWRQLRQKQVGYIFQQPKAYFNPSISCGDQLLELLPNHENTESKKRLIIHYCNQLQLNIQDRIFSAYPHEYSIGQLQRIYVISTLIREPKLIIADEPFAHLDWPTAKIVAKTLFDFVQSKSAALILISHERPGALINPNHIWKFENGSIRATKYVQTIAQTISRKSDSSRTETIHKESILSLKDIGKAYRTTLLTVNKEEKLVLRNISLSFDSGARIGLMGGSGSGKSTLASIITGLLIPTTGQIVGSNRIAYSISTLLKRRAAPIQLVFQDPYSSFNSSQSLAEQIISKRNKSDVEELAAKMDLSLDHLERNPRELSGGELQRFAIIRALSVNPEPKLLILDEALSAIDIQTQQKILEILDLAFPKMAILFISHRFERLAAVCSEIYFLEDGALVYHMTEIGDDHIKLPDKLRQLIE